jgi:hypothetical protein
MEVDESTPTAKKVKLDSQKKEGSDRIEEE